LLAEKKLDEAGARLEHSPQKFLFSFVISNFALLPKRTLNVSVNISSRSRNVCEQRAF
jgi:hypothetical protein